MGHRQPRAQCSAPVVSMHYTVNTEKIERRFPADEIDALLEARTVSWKNRKNRSGGRLLVGRSRSGQYITVVINPVPGDPGLWRPRTAWKSKPGETGKAKTEGV